MTDARDFISTLADAGKERLELTGGTWRALVVPALAGRVWVAAGDRVLHRFDAATVRAPSRGLGFKSLRAPIEKMAMFGMPSATLCGTRSCSSADSGKRYDS